MHTYLTRTPLTDRLAKVSRPVTPLALTDWARSLFRLLPTVTLTEADRADVLRNQGLTPREAADRLLAERA